MTKVDTYEVRPRKHRQGVNLISERLPFGSLSYSGSNGTRNAVSYAKQEQPVARVR
jgi:hypothetical protein